jgi:hypothetical protein
MLTLPFPIDPSLPSNPSPVFSDVTAARGDHLRANNAQIWSNLNWIASYWTTGVVYKAGQRVIYGNTEFQCLTNHTAGTFLTDWQTNGYWVPLGMAGPSSSIVGNAPVFLDANGKILTDSGYNPVTGWCTDSNPWTFVSLVLNGTGNQIGGMLTFTVPGDLTEKYYTGLKIKCTIGSGTVYGYVYSSTYGSSTTIVVHIPLYSFITSGSSITNPSFSRDYAPQGFPITPIQNVVTGSRSSSTVYHNCTGRPLKVKIIAIVWNGATINIMQAYSDSSSSPVNLVAQNFNGSIYETPFEIYFEVLDGNYYEIIPNSAFTASNWLEIG